MGFFVILLLLSFGILRVDFGLSCLGGLVFACLTLIQNVCSGPFQYPFDGLTCNSGRDTAWVAAVHSIAPSNIEVASNFDGKSKVFMMLLKAGQKFFISFKCNDLSSASFGVWVVRGIAADLHYVQVALESGVEPQEPVASFSGW